MSLKNIKIVRSELTGNLYVARFGKDPHCSQEKRLVDTQELLLMREIVQEKETEVDHDH